MGGFPSPVDPSQREVRVREDGRLRKSSGTFASVSGGKTQLAFCFSSPPTFCKPGFPKMEDELVFNFIS